MRFDILHIADLRFPGGTSSALAHEIQALAGAGYRVGLLQKRAARALRADRPINLQVQATIDQGQATLIDPAQTRRIVTRLAVLHNPHAFETIEPGLPTIEAQQRVMVVHQPVTDAQGRPYYDPAAVAANAERLVGGAVAWAPISPLSRSNLEDAATGFDILAEDWTNLIRIDDWTVDRSRPIADRPVIGRHSRAHLAKWPATRADVLTVYPDDPDLKVRLLGVDPALIELMGGTVPANWECLPFGAIEPRDFLAGVDFFVYYHHPDWVEGFGRTIAEAMAAGCVCILPEHFRATFGEAALYRRPEEVRAAVEELWQDREAMEAQGRLGRRWIDRHYGLKRYLARIERLIGAPGDAPAVGEPADPEAVLDVLHLGDFRTIRETAWRIANEVRIERDLGLRVGLLHLPSDAAKDIDVVNPEIDSLVDDGLARIVLPTLPSVKARLLVIHQPHAAFAHVAEGRDLPMPKLEALQAVVVYDVRMANDALKAKQVLLRALFGPTLIWQATRAELRSQLQKLGIQHEAELRAAAVWIDPAHSRGARRLPLPIIGRCGLVDQTQWANSQATIAQAYPTDRSAVVRVLGWPNLRRLPEGEIPAGWDVFAHREMNAHRFICGLDAFVYYPGEQPNQIQEYAILGAMAHGVPALVAPGCRTALGQGPIYLEAAKVQAQLQAWQADPDLLARAGADAHALVRRTHGPETHARRLRRLLRRELEPAAPAVARNRRQRVAFMSSNGVGLGHLTRLLAIARRLPGEIEPVFLTMSQAMPIVRQAGYPVEYLPYHVYANCDVGPWNEWLAEQLGQLLDFHDARALVFDGGHPYGGLIEAMARRRHTRFVWVRRGMWRETQNSADAIRRQRFFDLIIEPSDIAEAYDNGATAYHRALAAKVAPIRLLDEHELLDKPEACRRLGLDPEQPSCLIQLGSGSNRDIVSMIDTVLERVGSVPGMQPVLAEWLISPSPLDFWPGVRRLRGFPLARYFKAFDFTVSAAGYNSFNEIVSFGLPAVFMANDHATMDDQGARARFAQEQDAAFHLPDHRPDAIGPMIDAILDPAIRTVMQVNCARISGGNGAADAAAAIAGLV